MDCDDVWLMRNGFGVGAGEGHAAPSGLVGFIGPFSQGVALGYHIMPLWGGSPGPDGAENRCPVGADDRCVEVICLQPQRGVR
jgi:hypothetical protein